MIFICRSAALRRMICIVVALLCCATESRAAFITDFYNTGVNNVSAAIPNGAIDPHYIITVSPSGPSVARAVNDPGFPFPIWAANNANSRWIGPDATGGSAAGNYRYRTTFTVPANAILSTVNLSGVWGTDDPSIAMRINGNLTPNVSAGFTSLVPFTVNSGFVFGTNVLTVDLQNVTSVTGLRIDRALGTYQIIPEPATASLVCLGCIALAAVQRRRRQTLSFFTRRNCMNTPRQFSAIVLLLGFSVMACLCASPAIAHPLPGRDVPKFTQQPMLATTVLDANGTANVYHGHDELSTAYGFTTSAAIPPTVYDGVFMADDFADNFNSPVVHVKWWGSYLNNHINPNMPVNKFLISFESDVPAGPAPSFSHPGTPLLNQVVFREPTNVISGPGSGSFTENLVVPVSPTNPEAIYEYNAELHLGKEFQQKADTVYWLKIVAMVDAPPGVTFPTNQPPTNATRWGWHNRDYTANDPLASPNVSPGENNQGPFLGNPVWHFQDDAVTGSVRIDTTQSGGLIMPDVVQPFQNMSPTHYVDGLDGPGIPGAIGISQFSKDLAFELYTVVPEPTSGLLLVIGMAGFAARRRTALR